MPDDSVTPAGVSPSTRGTAITQTTTTMPRTANISSGQNVVQTTCSRLNSSVTSLFRTAKRCFSRFSWLNALTTRIPGIVSDSTSVTRDHLRHARRKIRFIRRPCENVIQHSS